MRTTFIYIIFTLISSCSTDETKLEKALRLAGNNRHELEKVLHHYSQKPADSLQLHAARFIIENMPGHYTLAGKEIEQFKEKIHADTSVSYFAKKLLEISISNIESIQKNAQKTEDVENIKSEFLIRHIDRSIERFITCPWLRDIPIDIFMEYVLPYRFEHEQPELWIDSLRITPGAWKEINASGIAKYAAWNNIEKLDLTRSEPLFHKDQIIQWLQQDIYDMCQHSALKDLFKSRASALPATIDFIPNFANRNGFHYWNRIISPEIKKISMRGTLERKAAKIYRKTYSLQNEIIPLKGEYIPEFFQKSFYKDVSDGLGSPLLVA